MEQRIENSEVFRLTDDQSAEWAVRKIREARRDTEQWEAHFAGQMERIRKANEETEAYFTTLLAEWFAIQPKRETRTQAKYSLPGADLVRRKQQPEYIKDDKILAAFLHTSDMDEFVELVPKPKWAELKKRCAIGPDGVVVDTENGVVLEGVRAEERPDKFEVKLRGEQDEP